MEIWSYTVAGISFFVDVCTSKFVLCYYQNVSSTFLTVCAVKVLYVSYRVYVLLECLFLSVCTIRVCARVFITVCTIRVFVDHQCVYYQCLFLKCLYYQSVCQSVYQSCVARPLFSVFLWGGGKKGLVWFTVATRPGTPTAVGGVNGRNVICFCQLRPSSKVHAAINLHTTRLNYKRTWLQPRSIMTC